ncbi:MAG: methyltransferase domain-containing protein [Gammaproteobacteria bacterium]|nr:methyltransferase domain-containing protein [Gammaproteobacteria bacterium]MYF28947.1 methyltransferase domain-containing protein [Gammaproteobacteria bacterium]MYK47042.1 methyltransferase domain-containing protein [Gammaproteobacteria bacterium]
MHNAPAVAIVILLVGAVASGPVAADQQVLLREQSLYHTILVVAEPTRRCLKFSVRDGTRNQSCVDPHDPKRMVFGYTRMMMAALLVVPEPQTVLVAGLGGGTLPTALAALLPDVRIDVVEIDPAVVKVARTYFDFQDSERVRVHVQDARVFVKRALQQGRQYDLVILDAYSGDYIPEHLMTGEFLEETRKLLTPDGAVAANTFATSQLYDYESETYRLVFGQFFNLRVRTSNNRVIVATNGPLPSRETLRANSRAWRPALGAYDVPITSYPRRMSTKVDWDHTKRALTDQYSPANLLKGSR